MKKNNLVHRNSWVTAGFQHKHEQNPSSCNFEGFIRQCCVMQDCDHCKFGLQVFFLPNCNGKLAVLASEGLRCFALTLVTAFAVQRKEMLTTVLSLL